MGAELAVKSSGKGAISRYEMLTAVEYMSGNNMGFICFSRTENSVTWFAVSEKYRGKGAGDRLLKTALRQLDTNKDITVNTFPADYPQGAAARALYKKHGFTEEKSIEHDGHPRCEMKRPASAEKRGGSFHYRYPDFIKAAQKENCPACNNELEDMPEADAAFFMNEVQRVGKALRKITGAVKINFEMHANTGTHLHIHLFPRYLDDEFPSAPIDYRVTEPAPYESYEEYLWFIEQMKIELKHEKNIKRGLFSLLN
jgi:predicted GNAT family acetyltransferase